MARSIASLKLPTREYSFVFCGDHAELFAPDGSLIRRFSEGFAVEEVEIAAHERDEGDRDLSAGPDLHSLLCEVLDSTGWNAERREAFTCDFLYALCVEFEEMRTVEEWRDGTDCEDDPHEMRPR